MGRVEANHLSFLTERVWDGTLHGVEIKVIYPTHENRCVRKDENYFDTTGAISQQVLKISKA
jgi:hypothetical protein